MKAKAQACEITTQPRSRQTIGGDFGGIYARGGTICFPARTMAAYNRSAFQAAQSPGKAVWLNLWIGESRNGSLTHLHSPQGLALRRWRGSWRRWPQSTTLPWREAIQMLYLHYCPCQLS